MAKNAGGRPRVKIDITELEKLCVLQCTQAEIAAFFGIGTATLERYARKAEYRDVMERGYLKGKISVRRKQMQLMESGNVTMAIWLGKQLLGQKDKVEHGGPDGAPIELNVTTSTEILRSRIARIAERVAKERSPGRPDA